MKRLVSLLLVLSMMLTLIPATVFAAPDGEVSAELANPFTDVKESDWFYDAVQYARINGFFNGTSETTFSPNGTMTRGMFVTVLGRMAGVNVADYKGQTPFKDVPENIYYAPYVAWAAIHGVTSGMSDEAFVPDGLINREQMATFFVRYFEAFNIDYSTGENISTLPADIEKVSSWAQEAVKSLWKEGLLNGDGTNFNPADDATRAQTAAIAQRTDDVVKAWYKEPGVLSDRVRINHETGLPYGGEEQKEEQEEQKKPSIVHRPTGGGSSSKKYYEVKFELGDESEDITLPETGTYLSGTPISSLPTPTKIGAIFLGWYYDAEMTSGVKTGDTVDRNMTLYANVATGDDVNSLETPNYVTRTEVPAGTYTFDVIGAANINSAFKFINITGGNIDVDYSVDGTRVTATLEPGQTYQVELTDNGAQFKLNGEDAQSESTRYLNILTAKETVANAELDKNVKQIPVESTSGLDSDVFEGLYQIDDSGVAEQNESSGTFTYNGDLNLNPGDTVAITSGNVDLTDATSTEGHVAYVNIVSASGDTYFYVMADLEDVLFISDVLPIQSNWDSDNIEKQITISADNVAVAMNSVEADSLDVGDFLGFLAPGKAYENASDVSFYGEITNVVTSGDNYIITYTDATEWDVENSLDVYYTQDREIELTDEEKSQIENDIKEDVQNSGYTEEAALYLASVMLESDNLEEIPDMGRVEYSMNTLHASPEQYGLNSVTRAGNGNKVKVQFDKNNIRVNVASNNTLEHLKGKGFDVSVKIPFTVTVTSEDGDNIYISVTAEFEEEVILKQNISTKRHKLGFLKYDYSLNASFEVGNYTGINFKADIDSADGGNKALSEKLEVIMKQMEAYQNGTVDSNDETMTSLSEIYQDVMSKNNDTWFDIIDVKLFETNGNAFLHIFCWQVKGSFVVAANLCVSLGMDFNYTMQKQYNFSVRVKAKSATNQVVDIIEPHYNFDFYVVGTLGIRAGLRLEMYVGLISLKLDKIGITAEVGAYTRLWGYFFYHLEWAQNSGKKSTSAGAMIVDIGIYLEIKFVAQAFSSSKLTWNPTLYSKEWPLWSAGEQKNIYTFKNTNDTNYTLVSTKTIALPGSTYDMKYMDLKNGTIGNVSKDDSGENNFIISFSNPAFTYNPTNNTVTVTPTDGALELETDMAITWKNSALSFTSRPIQKVIHLNWSDPEGMRYISFDTMGGSAVEQLSGGSDAPLTWPSNPTKQGYEFEGWYTDAGYRTLYSGSTTKMPTFPEGTKGMTLYSKWVPGEANYTVEHYLQELNGTYKLYTTETKTGKTESATNEQGLDVYAGFVAEEIEQKVISADGSTVVKVYYDRENYTLTFVKNDGSDETITQNYLYGESVTAPILAREGYTFNGWSSALPEEATATATYTANWIGNDNTIIFDSRGGSAVESAIVKTGERVEQPTAPTKIGCTFGGWYKDKLCTEVWNFNTDTVFGETTLYAKWTVTQHKVAWDTNGGNTLTGSGYTNGSVDYGTVITAPEAPTKDSFQGTNYIFAGWNTAKDGSGTAWENGVTVTGDVTYYAQWNTTLTKYTVVWMTDGISAETDSNLNWGTAITYDGAQPTKDADVQYTYTFDGWNTKADGSGDKWKSGDTVTGDVTYYAQFAKTVNQYKVAWDVNGGNELTGDYTSGSVDYGTVITAPDAPTKDSFHGTNYIFAGWNTAKDGSGSAWKSGDAVTGDVTYYAQWNTTLTKYTVVWMTDGISAETDSDLTWGTAITYDGAEPTKDADVQYTYTFDGWNTKADGSGDKWKSGDTVTGDVTYYAQFAKTVNQYTVAWDTNGGDEPVGDYTSGSVDYGTTIIAPDTPTRDAQTGQIYVFTGWNTAEDGSGIDLNSGDTVMGNVTYYAQWEIRSAQYTVNWNSNGGSELSGSYTHGTVDYGTTIVKPVDPAKDSTDEFTYTFKGWTTTQEDTGEYVTDFGTVSCDMTYYAQWEEKEIVYYNISIGDEEFSSANLVIHGDSGTATFDPDTFTMTLNNFKLVAESPENLNGSGSLILYVLRNGSTTPLNIVLIGDNHIENTRTVGYRYEAFGMYVWGSADVTITGEGSLTCIGGYGTGYDTNESSMSAGICTSSGNSDLIIDIGGTLIAQGRVADETHGLYWPNVVVNRGTVIAKSDEADENPPAQNWDGTYSEEEGLRQGSFGFTGHLSTVEKGAEFIAQGHTRALFNVIHAGYDYIIRASRYYYDVSYIDSYGETYIPGDYDKYYCIKAYGSDE
ncbi:MAG: InlB B-repeat-containing protein [Clostridia bacterium]|nr:InlB B-repeat-containing protein [Clostridia bacterium]